jgi:copper chaperone
MMMSTILNVSNIHCEACAKRVAGAIMRTEPDARAQVDVASGIVTVENAVDVAAILAALDKAGYPAVQSR